LVNLEQRQKEVRRREKIEAKRARRAARRLQKAGAPVSGAPR
jgi:hypothetical protein